MLRVALPYGWMRKPQYSCAFRRYAETRLAYLSHVFQIISSRLDGIGDMHRVMHIPPGEQISRSCIPHHAAIPSGA